MRGKAAREIRKLLKYKTTNKREYFEFTFPVEKSILQFFPSETEEGKFEAKEVKRVVEHRTIECISGDRKMYKYLKKKYVNINHTEHFNALPSQEDLNDTIEQFQEDFRAAKRRGVSSENEQDHGETNEEGRPDADSELRSSEESRD